MNRSKLDRGYILRGQKERTSRWIVDRAPSSSDDLGKIDQGKGRFGEKIIHKVIDCFWIYHQERRT